jgi:hypothetical protein
VKNDGDPKRLRSLASPDSLLGRGLATAHERGPTDADIRALGAAVFGASATGVATAATKAGAASVRVAGLTKATLALAVASTVAGTAGVAWHHRHRGPSSDAALSMPGRVLAAELRPRDVVPLVPAAEAPTSERLPSHVERRRATVPPIAARPEPAMPAIELPGLTVLPRQTPTDADEELRLVGAAQRALPRDPALALALAREHARRFPGGELAQERDAIAISALWETGQRDAARARARRFVQEHPGSTYVGQMREILRQAESPAP